MPLHSFQRLAPAAALGLWHLREPPAELWALLPAATTYQALLPAAADATRQAQWLAGRVLVHELASRLPIAAQLPPLLLRNAPDGRPWLGGAASGTVVSLSHSGEWVAALLAENGRAGIDVELVRDKARRIAPKFLAEHEWAFVGADAGPAAFSRLWSAKETLYKLAARRGLIFKEQLLLAAFEEQASGEIPATLLLDGGQTRHRICYSEPAPGYVLTYCYEPGP